MLRISFPPTARHLQRSPTAAHPCLVSDCRRWGDRAPTSRCAERGPAMAGGTCICKGLAVQL
jgi:hypothetical protein